MLSEPRLRSKLEQPRWPWLGDAVNRERTSLLVPLLRWGQFMNEIRNQANRQPSCFETCDLLGAPRIYEILGALGRPETAGGVEGVHATAIAAH